MERTVRSCDYRTAQNPVEGFVLFIKIKFPAILSDNNLHRRKSYPAAVVPSNSGDRRRRRIRSNQPQGAATSVLNEN